MLDALRRVRGAYSLVILTDNSVIAARDPDGFRPLALGKKDNAYVVGSETCAFDIIGAEYLRDVEPGELVVIDYETLNEGTMKSYRVIEAKGRCHHCIFEYIYFSRPDSRIFGENVDKVRRKLGKSLAEEHPVPPGSEEDKVIVISVPDSSNTATIGFVTQSNKLGYKAKFEIGLIRNHYVGRTFIQPEQNGREIAVRTKYNTVKGVLKDKTVVLVDDSIVRGTTSKILIKLLKEAKPKEIHVRISSPPIKHPCQYGMDFPSREELIANRCDGDIEKIRQELDVDSLEYLSIEKLLESVPMGGSKGYCTACFSGNYPVEIEVGTTKVEHEV
jgi:amidophosphoribosyltransferase